MPKFPANPVKEKVLTPEGTHIATLVKVIDLGTQLDRDGKSARKFKATFELPHETHDFGNGEQPLHIDQDFKFFRGNKSATYKLVQSLEGGKLPYDELPEDVDFREWVGKSCSITVTHNESNGRTYANVKQIAAVPKGTTVPAAKTDFVTFDLDNFDEPLFNKLPEWLQKIIQSSPEYATIYFQADAKEEEEMPWEEKKAPAKKSK